MAKKLYICRNCGFEFEAIQERRSRLNVRNAQVTRSSNPSLSLMAG